MKANDANIQYTHKGHPYIPKPILMKNRFRFVDVHTVEIILPYKGKKSDVKEFRALVDFRVFFDQLAFVNCKWMVHYQDEGRVYVQGLVEGEKIYLHRHVTLCPDGLVVHHVNHNGLDNRGRNLHVCTNEENLQYQGSNRSGRVGVSYRSDFDVWQARIQSDGRKLYRTFKNVDDAVNQRQAWELEVYGKTMVVDEDKWKAYVEQVEEQRLNREVSAS